MKKLMVVLSLILVLGAMLVSSVAAAGYAEGVGFSNGDPGPSNGKHAPVCKYGVVGNMYQITCIDAGKDIVNADVKSGGDFVVTSVKWDGDRADIQIALKGHGWFQWAVSDGIGNVTSGAYKR